MSLDRNVNSEYKSLPNCKLGLLSFIIALITLFLLLFITLAATYSEIISPRSVGSRNIPAALTIIFLFLIIFGNFFIIYSSFNNKNRNHAFTIAGLALNSIMFIFFILFFLTAITVT